MYKPSKERNWKNQQSYNWKIKFIATRKTLLPSVPYFFFIYWSPSLSLWTIFDSISSNIDEVLLITHLLMFLSLKALTSIIRTCLPILVELIDLVNSVIIFLFQMTLLRWLTFLFRSQTMILIVLLFWIYLYMQYINMFYNGFPSIGKSW